MSNNMEGTVTKHQAFNLAVKYALYSYARLQGNAPKAFMLTAKSLIEAQEETGIEMIDPNWLDKIIKDAQLKIEDKDK